uniref:C-type lectin domain-containing protein n=1 Tax=Poecilia mexicana TaxID=48701 RepID=A0A3B3Z239_9TELE
MPSIAALLRYNNFVNSMMTLGNLGIISCYAPQQREKPLKYNSNISYLYLSVLSPFLMGPGCKPCLQDWILFKKKCYLFYNEPAPWKTWEQSRRFCQDRRADLVVIDDLEEQVKSNGTYSSLKLIWKFLEN